LLIRIPGKAYIQRKLALGQDIEVLIKGAVVKEETEDNQDGSVNITYVVKPMTVELPGQSPSVSKIDPIELPEDKEETPLDQIPF
jgi:hypothetical protein